MLFYVLCCFMFVAFVGLNSNTILAMNLDRSRQTDTRSSRKCQYRSDTDPEYRIGAPLEPEKVRKRLDFINNILICVPKMNKRLMNEGE